MKGILVICLLAFLITPVSAAELTAPEVPLSAAEDMPEEGRSFGEGLLDILQKALYKLRPDLAEAVRAAVGVIGAVLLVSCLHSFSGTARNTAELVGTIAVASVLLSGAHSMLRLASATVAQMSDYGKLLLPVMTSALAAQGGLASSGVLYTGTAIFNTLLSNLISRLLVPLVYLFLALGTASSALGEETLKKLRDTVKGLVSWILKTILTVFTTYMGITGVVSGTTDAVTLKATKVTISSFVPVVGGILSDASEAVLVSAGMVKNAAGIYGIFAIAALFLHPFLQIGVHYLVLKVTAAICDIFGPKRITDLIGDFSGAMGLLLGMTGATCLLLLISTVCFMKGVG